MVFLLELTAWIMIHEERLEKQDTNYKKDMSLPV
jgi:hypothetical protein